MATSVTPRRARLLSSHGLHQCSLLAVLAVSLILASTASAENWTYWRGPSMNGVSQATNLPDEWDPDGGEGSNVLWKRDDLGTRSSPVVMDGRVYFLARHNSDTPKEQEKVVCLDAESGETVWENIFNVFLSDVPDTRVAWSSVVADPESGNVYSLGVCGLFQCIDAASGQTKWSISLSEEYGLLSTYGGRTNMPIIVDDVVIISAVIIGWGDMAKPAHRFMGFDKATGECRYMASTRLLPDDTTYSGPVLTAFQGHPALVFGAGDGGIYAMEPLTGTMLWSYDVSSRGINTTPTVDHPSGLVVAGHSEENLGSTEMGALFALNGNSAKIGQEDPKWKEEGLFCGKSAPLIIDGKIYAIDDRAKLHIVDLESGDEVGNQRMGTMQRMSPVYADGKIYTAEANGRVYVLKPEGDEVEFLCKERLPRGEEAHGSPAIANGRIYWPTTGGLYCIGNSGDLQTVAAEPTFVDDIELTAEGSPTQLQLVPAEALVEPGQTVEYSVRLFNEMGQFIRVADASEVSLSIETTYNAAVSGPQTGSLSLDGTVLATAGDAFVSGTVTASLKGTDLTSSARLRVEPAIDAEGWSFTFDDNDVPRPWIGAAYRMVTLDGELLASLRQSDPVAADLYIYLGSSLINSGAPALTYDDSTPAQKWSDLLRFFGIDAGADRPQTIETAKVKFESSLANLTSLGVLGGYEWSTWRLSDDTPERPRLKVLAGSREQVDNGVLVKIRTIPKGTRSQSWMGSPNSSDYTIQADVMGFDRDGKLPDIGLIGQRYTFDMMGASQQLQIRTWPPQLYMAQTVPFEWEPNTWYTLKFQTANEAGKAVLRGKVWKRGESEPADWNVVAEDDQPNTTGSPGLFGNAKDSEILYDNVTVTKNAS